MVKKYKNITSLTLLTSAALATVLLSNNSVQAATTSEKVGGGQSLLNPLPLSKPRKKLLRQQTQITAKLSLIQTKLKLRLTLRKLLKTLLTTLYQQHKLMLTLSPVPLSLPKVMQQLRKMVASLLLRTTSKRKSKTLLINLMR